MIDLSLWRARIGVFCGRVRTLKLCQRLRSRAEDENMERCVTLSDWSVICAVLCFCAMGMLLTTLVINLRRSFLPAMAENTIFFHNIPGGTVVGAFDTFDLRPSECDPVSLAPAFLLLCCASNAFFVLYKLLLSGDVEENPGPDTLKDGDKQNTDMNNVDTPVPKVNTIDLDLATQIMSALKLHNEEMKQSREEQREQNTIIRGELNHIKSELENVLVKCQEINDRCAQLETDQNRLSTAVERMNEDLDHLYVRSDEGREEMANLSTTASNLEQQISKMNEEIDRLEGFSRRDNLRFFGIPANTSEDYDTCAKCVVDLLNSVQGFKQWTEDDIVRAHRVGQARSEGSRTMIVKFRQWRDKMKIIRDRELRNELEEKGVRLANDLTKRQTETVARAKSEGKVAHFVKGKFIVTARNPDPRTYAEVAATKNLRGASTSIAGTNGKPSSRYAVNSGSSTGDSGGCVPDVRSSISQSTAVPVTDAGRTGAGQRAISSSDPDPLCPRDVTPCRSQSNKQPSTSNAARVSSPPSSARTPVLKQTNSGGQRDLSPGSGRVSPTSRPSVQASRSARGVTDRGIPGTVADSDGRKCGQGRGGAHSAAHNATRRPGNGRQTGMNSYFAKGDSGRSLRSNSSSK